MKEDICIEGEGEHKVGDKVHRSNRKLRVVDVAFISAYVQAPGDREKPLLHTLGSAPLEIELSIVLNTSANTPSVHNAIISLFCKYRAKKPPSWSSFSLRTCRDRCLPQLLCLARPSVLPPKNCAKNEYHEMDPGNHHPLAPGDVDFPLSLLPLVADLQKQLRIVRKHPIELLVYAPSHHVRLVDRPHVYRPPFRFHVTNEACAKDR